MYFYLSAYQIKVGLPEIRKGSFIVDQFNVYGSTIYRAYLAIPFIFELRSIIDWTFTKTALDVFQWIKLAQVQADMYVAKCVNKDYMNHKLGKQQPFWKKVVIGCTLTVFVLALIIFLLQQPEVLHKQHQASLLLLPTSPPPTRRSSSIVGMMLLLLLLLVLLLVVGGGGYEL